MGDPNQTVEQAVLTTVENPDPNQAKTRLALFTEDGRPFIPGTTEGFTGTFRSADAETVTVENGLIVSVEPA